MVSLRHKTEGCSVFPGLQRNSTDDFGQKFPAHISDRALPCDDVDFDSKAYIHNIKVLETGLER